MIDVTATTLPMMVRNDLSLLAQIACSAMLAASRNWCTLRTASGRRFGRRAGHRVVDLHLVAFLEVAHRRERPGDDFIAFLQALDDFEVFLAGDAGGHGRERRVVVDDHEHT